MQVTNVNRNINNNNNISYKALKITCKDTWHPELLKEVLNNKEIKKASEFLETRNSNMEMELFNNGTSKNPTYSVGCTYDRRYKPQGENCTILHKMSLEDALHKLKNFNSRNFIAFVKKAERTNIDKFRQLRQMRMFHHHTQKQNDNGVMHKLLKFFGF